jgi:hypothetical protein
MWRAPLRYRDSHARTVYLFSPGRCCARTCNIAVIDLHERRAECEVVCTSGVARSKSDVPIVCRKAFIIACRIVVRLEFYRNAETSSRHRLP